MLNVSVILNTSGLGFCMIGAFIAAWGFIKTKNSDLFDQASQCWGYNGKLYEALVEQRDKAITGFVLIFIGTVLQLVSPIFDIPLNISKQAYFLLLIINVVTKLSQSNVNSIMIKKELDNYYSVQKKLKEQLPEQRQQENIKHRTNLVHSLGNRLKVSVSSCEPNFEDIVIAAAEKYIGTTQGPA